MRVLRSRGTELERDFAFGVVRQLFEPSLVEASEDEHADLLHGAAGVAAGLLGLPGAPPADGSPSLRFDPSFAILHGLYWLCANLAAVQPLCLLVDDAHWADAASLRYLAFLLTRLEELDVTLVVAIRPREAATDAELLTTVTTDSSARVLQLSPLTRSAVVELLEAGLGRAPDPGLVDTCLRVTRGMPFLLRELVEAVSEGGIGSAVGTVGRSVRLRLRPAPGGCGAARASPGDSRAGQHAPGGAPRRPRRARGSRCSRSAGDRGDPRARPAADVRASHRAQRDLFGALERRARAGPPPRRRTARRAAGRIRARRPAPAGQRARRRRLGGRASGRGGLHGGEAGLSGFGGGFPAPCARRAAAAGRPGGVAARPGNGRGECGARRLGHAPGAGRRHRPERRDGGRGRPRARARAQPRPALRGGGHGARSRRDFVRHPRLGPRTGAGGRRRRRRAERPSDCTISRPPPSECARPRRGRARGAARAAGDGRVHLRPHERARRARRRPRRPGAARRGDVATTVGDPAVVRIHDVVLAGDALAALGRAVCRGAAAARCVDRAGPDVRRQQPACRRPGSPRLAGAPARRSDRRGGRRTDGACRGRAPGTNPVPRPERRCARCGAHRSGRARRGRAGARAARLGSRERVDHGCGSSRRPRPAARRTGAGRGRTRGLPGRRPGADTSADRLPELPPLALAGGARPSRARRARAGPTPRRRGGRARPGIRHPARTRRGKACRRRHCRR